MSETSEAIDRIGNVLYTFRREERAGLTESEARNIVTNLGPTIANEIRAAILAERQRALNICTNVEPGDGATMRQTIRARIASGE